MGNYQQEREEAIRAGENALACLYDARTYLESARSWGIFDIFGGGFISTFVKHSKIDKARAAIWAARNALAKFDNELDDINMSDVDLGIGDLACFADWFFDGLIADIYVQSKINEARGNVEVAIMRVDSILRKIK